MPYIQPDYKPPGAFINPHVHTIAGSLLRKTKSPELFKEYINTRDGDRIVAFRTKKDQDTLAVLVHGLGGHHQSKYILGMANTLVELDIQCCLVNLRGAGPEPNLTKYSYHAGRTDDLHDIVAHYTPTYKKIILIGFSLGGNIVLKYMGEDTMLIPDSVLAGVGISVPLSLADSAFQLAEARNRVYTIYFKRKLDKLLKAKLAAYPDIGFDLSDIKMAKTIQEIDDLYTAPVHGYGFAENYYQTVSSHQFLAQVDRPTLIINAQDDPFLPWSCYPVDIAKKSQYLTLNAPNHGGHVGFAQDIFFRKKTYAEEEVVGFIGKDL
jgi:predicted alpha/beta-fold hydrolase